MPAAVFSQLALDPSVAAAAATYPPLPQQQHANQPPLY